MVAESNREIEIAVKTWQRGATFTKQARRVLNAWVVVGPHFTLYHDGHHPEPARSHPRPWHIFARR